MSDLRKMSKDELLAWAEAKKLEEESASDADLASTLASMRQLLAMQQQQISQLSSQNNSSSRPPQFKGVKDSERLDLETMGASAVVDWIEWFDSLIKLQGFESSPDSTKIDIFYSCCTPDSRQKLKSLIPTSVTTTVKSLLSSLKDHVKLRSCYILERVKMSMRKQLQGESISDYTIALSFLARDCEFSTAEKSDFIKQCTISGLTSDKMREKIVVWDNLKTSTTDEFVDRLKSLEMAEKTSDAFSSRDFTPIEHLNRAFKSPYQRDKQGRGFESSGAGKPIPQGGRKYCQ